jgi:hypothetical protein
MRAQISQQIEKAWDAKPPSSALEGRSLALVKAPAPGGHNDEQLLEQCLTGTGCRCTTCLGSTERDFEKFCKSILPAFANCVHWRQELDIQADANPPVVGKVLKM